MGLLWIGKTEHHIGSGEEGRAQERCKRWMDPSINSSCR